MGSFEHPFRSALLFVASLTPPAMASAQAGTLPTAPAPWAVEAPGAAGSRFGLGLDVFFERQESLRIVRLERTIQIRDLGSGRGDGEVFREDPALLNRKFDVLLEMEGVGSELAVALPHVGAPGAFQLFPTLIARAAWADVQLDFQDRTRAGDSTSYQGQGPLLTTGLDLTAALCRSCPWFAGTSYRFQKLPGLTVDRSPGFAPPGFTVLDDEVRLEREVQEVSTRVGASFSGNRLTSYLGVRYRWTDLAIEDGLRYRDPLGRSETSLSSQTGLDSEVTLALAGIEAHLGGSFYGRLETSVGDEDLGAWMQVVYLPRSRGREEADAIDGDAIAQQLHRLRAEFEQSFDTLPEPVDAAAVQALLSRFEERLLALLPFPRLAAMQDWVRLRFRRARGLLGAEPPTQAAFRTDGFMPAANRLAQSSGWVAELTEARDLVLETIDLLIRRFENDDIRVTVCVQTYPDPGASVSLYSVSYPQDKKGTRSHNWQTYYRGSHGYEVRFRSTAFGYGADGRRNAPLDLMTEDRPLIDCDLAGQECFAWRETAEKVKCGPDKR